MEDQQLRILVVAAHPHDFTHVAGTCGVHTALGDQVTVVAASGGIFIHNERLYDELRKPKEEQDAIVKQPPEAYAEIKEKELRDAAAMFGVTDVRILDFPEPFRLDQYRKAEDDLADIILDVRPHVLISHKPMPPYPYVGQSRDDHSEVAFATLEARTQASAPSYGDERPPHTIASTLFPGAYYEKDEYDFVVDVSDWFEQRVEAEATYKTQGHDPAFARRRIETNVGNVGWFSGTMYAEGFVRERPELWSKIELSPLVLRRAEEPHHTQMQRMSGQLTDEE